jgi:hypothetical protein
MYWKQEASHESSDFWKSELSTMFDFYSNLM